MNNQIVEHITQIITGTAANLLGGALTGNHGKRSRVACWVRESSIVNLERESKELRLFLGGPASGAGNEVKNLRRLDLCIRNTGPADFSAFRFGITLPETAAILHAEWESSDRHHTVAFQKIQGDRPGPELDLTLLPFHCDDRYVVRFYVGGGTDVSLPRNCRISSPEPVSIGRSFLLMRYLNKN